VSEAIHKRAKSGLLRRFTPRNDEHSFAISPHNPREFCRSSRPLKTEGAGNAGRWMRPQPRVQNKTKHTSIITTVTPETPGIPRAMVLTVSSALSPATNSFCHRRLPIDGFVAPG